MAAILLDRGAMHWKTFVLCALLFVSLPTLHAADPTSYREIAMLLRNGENPQFIIQDTTRRKLLQSLTPKRSRPCSPSTPLRP
ncbi:MAG: hypothetical protein WDN28_28560 [Chthoniobacter sp.]